MLIPRPRHVQAVLGRLQRNPVVAITGARQVGKTTLARLVAECTTGPTAFFDLEDPRDRDRLVDPILAFGDRHGLVVIDEVQLQPGLFPLLRVLADRPENPTRFLLLGSASPELLRQGAESLAGRISFYELRGFDLSEVGPAAAQTLWFRGGLPRSYLADDDGGSCEWRRDFLRTFLTRDLPQLGVAIPAETLRRFWTMLGHYHGQVWNASELARAFGVSDVTVRRYLDLLCATHMVRLLLPWHENIGKRQVKAPKLYVADSGLLHTLLRLDSREALDDHPKVGASWEGFALEVVLSRLQAFPEDCFFWATHNGAELDLLVVRGDRRLGFEFKRSSVPRVTPSMRSALADLGLDRIDVVYPGAETFPLAPRVRAVGLARVGADVEVMGGGRVSNP